MIAPVTVDDLVERIAARHYSLGVIGLGYVGLPLALTACEAGFAVVGFDVNPARVAEINAGTSFTTHVADARIASALAEGRFEATTNFDKLASVDAVIIAVPTPLTKTRDPDLSHVADAARQIARRLRPQHLVVLESTTWPGTTMEVVAPILDESGLRRGADYFLAYSPEREDPGNREFRTAVIPKVVGGDGAAAATLATALYQALVTKVVPVSSTTTAEAVKLTENIFRSVNIALVNELKLIYDKMGIDVWEVIEAAKTKPFGFMPFYPGPGLGGHCIPIDPFYLTWKAREFDFTTRFIELAGQINTAMPQHVVDRLAEALDRDQGRGLSGVAILVLGIAYKKNIDDLRESPSIRLIELLELRSSQVDFHDPHVPVVPPDRDHTRLGGRRSVELTPEALGRYNVVLIATDHDAVDYGMVVASSKLVIDTRNVCERLGLSAPHVIKA
ncbi:nucleotide sugar dehydrogenase [Hyphomicrobiales bacterium BP6-180914]|uniref:Nucleotide sugar dehydrogenase n=1 Tax=Lichenifustis flavocetrariae TaxID=2949735 RepID=A0AA42CGX1_9HYPH|nr:nucleotide sugar dehydrogenase [Lichenifustis flavocetrariae]MCW6506993.1 nucleotide sugar dehydrogenase [Lichenifustis flavocetrariae]